MDVQSGSTRSRRWGSASSCALVDRPRAEQLADERRQRAHADESICHERRNLAHERQPRRSADLDNNGSAHDRSQTFRRSTTVVPCT
jgi:hypothetical protein